MVDKQIIPFSLDLNEVPVDNSLAIVPMPDQPESLKVIPPPRKLAYFARVHEPVLPPLPERLRLKDAPPKGSVVKLAPGVTLLPPKDDEVLTDAKFDKSGNLICAKYSSRPTIDGVRAHPSKVKFIPLKKTPKRPAPPLEKEGKQHRTTIAMLDVCTLHHRDLIDALQQHNTLLAKNVDKLTELWQPEREEHRKLTRRYELHVMCNMCKKY
jgi:hypothetical protein